MPKWHGQAARCEPENAVPALLPSLPTPFSSAVNSPFPFQNSSGASGLCFSSTCSYLPPALPRRAVQRRRFGGSLSAACRCPQARPVVPPAGTGPTSSTPGAPITSPCAYPVPSFTYLKQKVFIIMFFLFSVPALEAQGHPGSGSGGAVGELRALKPPCHPPTSRRELDAGQLSCWGAMSGLRAPSLHRGQIFPAGLLGDMVRQRAASGGDGAVPSSFTFTLSQAYQGCWGPSGVTPRGQKV